MLFTSEIVSRSTRQLFSLAQCTVCTLKSASLPPYPTCVASGKNPAGEVRLSLFLLSVQGESFEISEPGVGHVGVQYGCTCEVTVPLLQVTHAIAVIDAVHCKVRHRVWLPQSVLLVKMAA